MPVNLFIDTNILLSFFHLSSDDLEELKKLVELVRTNAVRLHLPQQVKDEFLRNRDNKIFDALKRLQEQKLNLQFPQICRDYEDYKSLRDAQDKYERAHSALLRKLRADIDSEGLKADHVVHELFAATGVYATSAEAYGYARYRADVGNPPGKNGSLGDAINWEVLLERAPQSEELHFVTDDGDYASPLDSNMFHSFLATEWKTRKGAVLRYHRRLSLFFKEKYPQIELASGVEKEVAIAELASSVSYSITHDAIVKLEQFSDFTTNQATALATAATTNSQIYQIIQDDDVKNFFDRLTRHYGTSIEPSVLTTLKEKMASGGS